MAILVPLHLSDHHHWIIDVLHGSWDVGRGHIHRRQLIVFCTLQHLLVLAALACYLIKHGVVWLLFIRASVHGHRCLDVQLVKLVLLSLVVGVVPVLLSMLHLHLCIGEVVGARASRRQHLGWCF